MNTNQFVCSSDVNIGEPFMKNILILFTRHFFNELWKQRKNWMMQHFFGDILKLRKIEARWNILRLSSNRIEVTVFMNKKVKFLIQTISSIMEFRCDKYSFKNDSQ